MVPKLMSYNQLDFQSKANLELHVSQLESETEIYSKQLEQAGMLSFTLTQVWNKQGKHRLGLYFSYRDEKAFIDCQKIINGIPDDEENPMITNADRGVVRLHVVSEE
ncbi:hypothetical protein OAS27_05855 [Alphaproteobacteria bacterium]|jgi:hypothetical protein|nr:hypothetical protein [Alphaproteobacteria bacterium]RCL79869.1 MAG: hypothetical protein DBW68_01530 [SAR116 cluster bacterium]CAI8403585.1 MAG: Uncharacterised protein [SAR116 cluster bacterium]|tara:strand:- start:438 stop:758 length:321 start_codon:yes stop_codon:yes gene_type:complete